MQIEKMDLAQLESIYGIKGKLLNLPNEAVYAGSMLGVLDPGETTRYHRHHDNECFIILQGSGTMYSNNELHVEVNTGDLIYLQPGDGHLLKNNDSQHKLIFASIWWAAAQGAVIPNVNKLFSQAQKRIIIAPPPTPNGDLHLGHLAGPYLAADIFKRFSQQQGISVSFLTGSDDHQSYVDLKAQQMQINALQAAEYFAERIKNVFTNYHLTPDIFYQPLNNPAYVAFVQNYLNALFAKKIIQVKETQQPYCEQCQRWLYEAHLSGLCPHCFAPCGGGSCETCGLPNACTDMIDSYCKYCRSAPQSKPTQYCFIALENYRKPLQTYLEQLRLPAHIRSLIRQLFSQPLPEIAVTHHSKWGISAPFIGFEQQKICSWCEMAPAYLFVACLALGCQSDQVATQWQNFWNAIDHRVTLFFGFDNSFFYLILLPCLLIAYDAKVRLPDEIVYNEFYLFEENKFSTSRNHAVWANDIIQRVPSDYLRYYLATTRPEITRTQFSYTSLLELIKTDLVENLSLWVIDLATQINLDFNNLCPDGGEWNSEHDEFIYFLQSFLLQYEHALTTPAFSPVHAVRLLRNLVLEGMQLATSRKFLQQGNKTNRLEYQTSMVMELTALKYYALACAAIMPDYAKRLAQALNLSTNLAWESTVRLIPKNTAIRGLADCVFHQLTLSISGQPA